MSIFDPYSSAGQQHPGLNVGGTTQVSTLAPVATHGIRANRYRSGALSALAPFLGYLSVVLAIAMAGAGVAGHALCLEDRIDAAVCQAPTSQLALVPLAVLFFGLVFATIGGSLAKKRRAAASLIALVAGFAAIAFATQWFSGQLLGLPFP